MIDNPDLDLLSNLLENHPEASEPLGLFLTPELKPSGYDTTPTCCRTLAWTGGDGVHFSLAELGEVGTPVVMTVPMNFDAPNLLIGNDLRDFLALGLRTGYFGLEELVYDPEVAISRLSSGFDIQGPALAALEDIQEAFGLVPWTNVRSRLDVLQARYGKALNKYLPAVPT